MKRNIICTLLISCLLSIISCNPKSNFEAEKTQVKAVVDNFATFWEKEDTTILSAIFDHDPEMVNYGAEPKEVFVGWKALKDSLVEILPAFDQTKVTVKNQVIQISASRDVAWFSEIMDWDLLYKGQPAHLPNQRLTGVLVKKDGKWVIVQFHNSVPGAE